MSTKIIFLEYDRNCLKPVCQFARTDIFITLTLPVHKHGVFLYLFRVVAHVHAQLSRNCLFSMAIIQIYTLTYNVSEFQFLHILNTFSFWLF